MSDQPQDIAIEGVAAAGRPSKFSQKLANEICALLIEGLSLREICVREGMPHKATICRWLSSRDIFREQYARAREMQAELMADELLDIADDGRNDWIERRIGEEVVEVVNQEAVQRSKLRVDTRKWIASKLVPKKYGEALDLKHSGKVDMGVARLTDEQLDAEIAQFARLASKPDSDKEGAA